MCWGIFSAASRLIGGAIVLASAAASHSATLRDALILRGATVFTTPSSPPIANGVVVIRGDKIVAVGKSGIRVPKGRTIDCRRLFITAGFQNSHVHFTEPKWDQAARLPAQRLSQQLRDMLTRFGVTTAVDAASFLDNTVALRTRIDRGEVVGPRIITAGAALYPANGIPWYLRQDMDAASLARLRAPASVDEAVRDVSENFNGGADALKLFTVTWISQEQTASMDTGIATAAANAAHRRGKLVLVHPSNVRGLEIALHAHADVLMHAVEDRRGSIGRLMRRAVAADMAMVPTLALFERSGSFASVLDEVREFHRLGGQIMFGTDIGFRTDYDPKREYQLMAAAGLSPMDILASLTTVPAERFGEGRRRGRVAVGQDADLVVLGSDPRKGADALADVKMTIRGGHVIFDRAAYAGPKIKK